MNKNNRLLRTGIAVALAALMAGASTSVLLTAMGLPCGAAFAYLPGLLAALLLGLGGCSGALAAVCAIAGVALTATAVAFNLDAFGALRAARKRLDAELSRPREEVEHTRALHLELDGGENALLDLVGGRAGIITL